MRLVHSDIVVVADGWADLCTEAAGLLSKLAAILLIDTTRCGLTVRPVLEAELKEQIDHLHTAFDRRIARRPKDHLGEHFFRALREMNDVSAALARPAPAQHSRLERQLSTASKHLQAIAAAEKRGPLFNVSQCCGGHREPMVLLS